MGRDAINNRHRPQYDLEAEMVQLGIDRYKRKRRKAEEKELETTTPAGQWLLQTAIDPLSKAIEDWMSHARSSPGKAHRALTFYEMLHPDLAAALIARTVLDAISHSKKFTATAMQVATVL